MISFLLYTISLDNVKSALYNLFFFYIVKQEMFVKHYTPKVFLVQLN